MSVAGSTMLLVICFVIALTACATGAQAACCCPTYWTAFEEHCYRFFGDRKSWQDAENHCQSHSVPSLGSAGTVTGSIGHLVSIHSEEEQNFVSTFFRTSHKKEPHASMWLGLHDMSTEGDFQWSDGTPMDFTKWSIGQPDDYQSEDWGYMMDEDLSCLWNDSSSPTKPSFMCKLPGK